MNVLSASSAMAAQVASAANAGAQQAPAEKAAPAPATDTVSLSPQAKAHLAAQKSCGC